MLPAPVSRPVRTLLTALIAFLVAAIGWAAPVNIAHAVPVYCGKAPTQEGYLADPRCAQHSMLRLPGQHSLLTRQDFLDNLGLMRPYLGDQFDADFFRTAAEVRVYVPPNAVWTGCWNNPGGLCPEKERVTGPVGDTYANGLTLTGFLGKEGFVPAMCANVVIGFVPKSNVAKTDFRLVDPPSRITADTDTKLTLRVALENKSNDPLIVAHDTVTVTGPDDCTVSPSKTDITASIVKDKTVTRDVSVTVRCANPSEHEFTFDDQLNLAPGFLEEDPKDNHARLTHSFPVYDDSDIAVTAASLTCADDTTVGAAYRCTGSATVTNRGEYGPTTTQTGLTLDVPDDCTSTATGPAPGELSLGVNVPARIDQTWSVTCAHRSFHTATLTATAAANHLHVEDLVPGNDRATATARTQVFEDVDLRAEITSLQCDEREFNGKATSCDVTIKVSNAGPATDVKTLTSLAVDPASECTATPIADTALTLASGRSETISGTTQLTCATASRHVVGVTATIRNAPDDPHARDTATANNTDTRDWNPLDVKPRSLPSAVNPRSNGSTPFAILGTAETSPQGIDTASVHFGATGTERSVQRCQYGEDVNDDGYPDLVCHATTRSLALTCDSEEAAFSAVRTDGTKVVGQDAVKIAGCNGNAA